MMLKTSSSFASVLFAAASVSINAWYKSWLAPVIFKSNQVEFAKLLIFDELCATFLFDARSELIFNLLREIQMLRHTNQMVFCSWLRLNMPGTSLAVGASKATNVHSFEFVAFDRAITIWAWLSHCCWSGAANASLLLYALSGLPSWF